MSDPSSDPRSADGSDVGDDSTSLARKALDVLVFAPAGLVLTAVEDLPKVVAKGRSHLELRIRNARFVGQLVVGRGHHELRQRWERLAERPGTSGDAAEPDERAEPIADPGAGESLANAGNSPPLAHAPDAVTDGGEREHPRPASMLETRGADLVRPAPRPHEGPGGSARPGAEAGEVDAAIPGYDSLSASHVVRRLDGLRRQELEAVGRYESSTRGRRTILNRVHQLLSAEVPPDRAKLKAPDMEDVRRALDDDLPRCVQLLRAALEESADARGADQLTRIGIVAGVHDAHDDGPRTPADVVARWFAGATGDEAPRTLLVGTIDSVVVGLAAASVAPRQRRAGRIDCCYVEPEAREVGVGAKLIESLLAWFVEHRCDEVDALALPGDRSTKQLFESSGFKTRLLVLHRSTS